MVGDWEVALDLRSFYSEVESFLRAFLPVERADVALGFEVGFLGADSGGCGKRADGNYAGGDAANERAAAWFCTAGRIGFYVGVGLSRAKGEDLGCGWL